MSLSKRGWKECKLGDVAEFGNGKARPKTEGLIPVYGGNGILSYCDQFNYNSETIIIGRVGAYCGSVYYENKPVWVSDNALSVKTKSKNNTKFLFYFLKNLNINQLAEGSSHPLITQTLLKSIDVIITDNENEQRVIAGVLSSLDDKIDLLRRQNKTLEGIAESLWRKMFVEDADPKWPTDVLGNLFDIGIGRTPPRIEQHWFTTFPSDVKWISIKDMGNCGVYIDSVSEYLTKEAVREFNIPIIPDNTVLLSFKMTVGRVAITTEEMISNEAIAHFKIKEQSYLISEYLYFFLKTFKYESLGSTSSIVEAINSQMIKEFEIKVPPKKLMGLFKDRIESYFLKIRKNQFQIRTLSHLQDTLLPKLMSGEVYCLPEMV